MVPSQPVQDLPAGINPRIVCAWCRAVLEEGTAGHGVSHGICEPCAVRVLAEEERRRLAVLQERNGRS